MHKDCPTQRPKRQAVLIVADGDYIEVFGDLVDVHVAKMPQAETRRGERIADACLERMLPMRYRDLYDRSLLRGNAIVRPLTAEAALEARQVKRQIKAINKLAEQLESAK